MCYVFYMRDPVSSSRSLKGRERERSTLRLKVTYLVAELGFEPCWLTPEHTHLILHCDKLSELLIS